MTLILLQVTNYPKEEISQFTDADIPDHDLQPPRFSRTALEQLLDDWAAVKAMVMSGTPDPFAEEQSGTALLDKFTYRLLSKCTPEVINLTNSYNYNVIN